MDAKMFKQQALSELQVLVGLPMGYAIDAEGWEDLIRVGFGDPADVPRDVNPYQYELHVMCPFKLIWREEKRKEMFWEYSSQDMYLPSFRKLVGHEIKRVGLSDKNDLWLDLGFCWIVFCTYDDGEESWRFMSVHEDSPHLYASDTWIEFC